MNIYEKNKMSGLKNLSTNSLSLILTLIGAHSFLVGLCLIIQPVVLMRLAGFSDGYEHFFPAQGGIFHVVMAVCYVMAALELGKRRSMVVYSIIVKTVATIFLLTYYFAVDAKWVILFSGLGDGLMGVAILWTYINYVKSLSIHKEKTE